MEGQTSHGSLGLDDSSKSALARHYCAWLSNEGHVSVDPAAKMGVAVRAQRAAKVRRKDFTPEQMRLLSDALVKRRQTATTKYLNEYYWICQVVLFSGMRSAEAWNLWTDRIQVTDGVPFFDLQESKEREVNLKTNTSARRVPVHSGLIKLGFLSYLDERRNTVKTQKAVRLFPHIADKLPGVAILHGDIAESRHHRENINLALDTALLGDSVRPCWCSDGTKALPHRACVTGNGGEHGVLAHEVAAKGVERSGGEGDVLSEIDRPRERTALVEPLKELPCPSNI